MKKQITYSKLGKNGRLGNQLFQLASSYALAVQTGRDFLIPTDWEYKKYFKNLKNKLQFKDVVGFKISERVFNYDIELKTTIDNCSVPTIDIKGYLQSEFYFQPLTQEIRRLLTFKDDFVAQTTEIFKQNDVFDKETIAISIRRGDYVNNPNYITLGIAYYINTLMYYFPNYKDMNIIIFSDDIPYCRVHFGCLKNVYYSENNSAIEDLCLMSQCDHFILANSTFSWWGAWLGEKPDSIIIRPQRTFDGDLLIENGEGTTLYPTRWNTSPFDYNSKIFLSDTTFIIPYKEDSEDRKKNLELCLNVLNKDFHTNLIVGVGEHESLIAIAGFSMTKLHLNTDQLFHRTKMLNDMTKLTTTQYVANWDCDVFIPPLQVLLAVQRLRNTDTVLSYPYEWAFARMPRNKWYGEIKSVLDIGIVRDHQFNGMLRSDEVSVGGAVIFNKELYTECGLENENFISFGPEDLERIARVRLLGKKVYRTAGNLYHLNHWVGDDSTTNNPYFQHNNDEFDKVREMTEAQLKTYINTWQWI